jgi:maleate cis-trans isomerase
MRHPGLLPTRGYDILIYASGSARSIRGSGMNHMIATKMYKAQDTQGLTNVRAMATT